MCCCPRNHSPQAPYDRRPSSILEKAAQCATIATFELLRAKGAPVTERAMFLAVESAAAYACKKDRPEDDGYDYDIECLQRLDMVRYLADVLKLDFGSA